MAGGAELTRKQNVDQQIRPAAALKEDAERRQQNGEDDFDDVAVNTTDTLAHSSLRHWLELRGRVADCS